MYDVLMQPPAKATARPADIPAASARRRIRSPGFRGSGGYGGPAMVCQHENARPASLRLLVLLVLLRRLFRRAGGRGAGATATGHQVLAVGHVHGLGGSRQRVA